MKVTFIHRAKSFGGFSFEELFATIQKQLTKCNCENFYDKTYPRFFKNIKAVKQLKSDVYHLTGGLGYYTLFLPSKRTLLTIHDTNHYEHDLKGLKKWVFGWLFYRLAYRNTYCLTTVSEHTRSRLIQLFGFDKNNIRVIPNCYPNDFKVNLKESLNETTKILQIGTKTNKNIHRLIDALKGMDVELTIIGKLSAELTFKLNENKISYLNKTNLSHDEIYKEYVNCDLVSFISLYEGFGLPIIEANSVGRAVITSSVSSMPEVAGTAAHLINPYDVSDIKNGLIKLIKDHNYRNELISNGFENIKKYQPQLIAQQYEELYQKIASRT